MPEGAYIRDGLSRHVAVCMYNIKTDTRSAWFRRKSASTGATAPWASPPASAAAPSRRRSRRENHLVVFSENTVGPGHKDAPRTLALGSWSLCVEPRLTQLRNHAGSSRPRAKFSNCEVTLPEKKMCECTTCSRECPRSTGQQKGDSTSLQRECSARARSEKSTHASRPLREMIARPKISRNEWKTAEI